MIFPTEQQVEAASQEIFYVLGRYHIYPSMAKEAARAALTALAPEWQEMEIRAMEAQRVREQMEYFRDLLSRIHALLTPPDVECDGKRYTFAPQDPSLCLAAWKELSERIRRIPQDIDDAREREG